MRSCQRGVERSLHGKIETRDVGTLALSYRKVIYYALRLYLGLVIQ
jgi:hypothetical protein